MSSPIGIFDSGYGGLTVFRESKTAFQLMIISIWETMLVCPMAIAVLKPFTNSPGNVLKNYLTWAARWSF